MNHIHFCGHPEGMYQINPQMRKMVVFDLDNTVLQGRFIDACARKYNFRQALALLRNIDTNSISLARRTALFLEGKSCEELIRVADEIPIVKDIPDVIKELKRRNYEVGLITDSYQLVAEHIASQIGADFYISYEMRSIDGIVTGEVIIPRAFMFSESSTCEHPVCKTNALRQLCGDKNVELNNCIVVGDGDTDVCMVKHAGFGVAFCTSNEILRKAARKTINQPAFSELLTYAS